MQKFIKSMRIRCKHIEWQAAPDIEKRLVRLIGKVNIEWVQTSKIHCFRSRGANTRAYARIWGLAKIWQLALDEDPAYVIEVISEKFDKLEAIDKDKVLLHELTHIPKNFSGSLVPHIRRGKRNFNDKVRSLISQYLNTR